MGFEIENIIDAENKEVYSFNNIDLNAVFVRYGKYNKPKGKRKWNVTDTWSVYERRSNTLESVPLPESIRSKALTEMQEMVRVKTWDEYKSR